MALDQDRSATADVEARVDSGEHGGLDSKLLASASLPERDETEISTGPDGSPLAAQPPWRRDFPIDWPVDQFVARRDFAKFLVLTSGAFVTGQAWIAAQHLIRSRRPAPPRVRIASLSATPPGSSQVFGYPDAHDKCLLIRSSDGELLAYSQACTHLSCAVVPRIEEGVLHCPCHEGYFDLKTGRNIAGPPPRPLPKIELSVEGDDIYAIGIDERTV